MPARALIIAIEDYPAAVSLAKQLPGTNDSATEFRDWLIQKKGLDARSILACAAPACAWRTSGTSRDEIVEELRKLATAFHDENNDELYFFFSGHGFSHESSQERIEIDVFVSADFIDADRSGDACLQFQEIQKKLVTSLGPGKHYYFIDACRNPMSREHIEVPIMGKRFPVSSRGRSKYYALYSTALGQVAKVSSGFADLLLQGLNGAGTAKRWEKGDLVVTFEHLRKYVRDKLRHQEVDAQVGADEDGLILQIQPIPQYDCEVVVVNAEPTDTFTLTVSHQLIAPQVHPFTGRSIKVNLKPFDYFLQVTHPSADVVPVGSRSGAVSVYETAIAEFEKRTIRGLESMVPQVVSPTDKVNITLRGARGTQIELVNDESGDTIDADEQIIEDLAPGRYTARVFERGLEIERRDLFIEPSTGAEIDLLDGQPRSPLRDRILKYFSHATTLRYAEFSETLGVMANPALSLWLSIFGASHILGDPHSFRLLQHLGLDSFKNVQRGDSPVYVLFGSDQVRARASLGVGLTANEQTQWQSFGSVAAPVDIHECRLEAADGLNVVSLRIADESPVSVAAYCLPNCVTFLAIAEDVAGKLTIHQYLLPLHTLSQYLDPKVRAYIEPRPLAVVRTMALAQSHFACNKHVQFPEHSDEQKDWEALLSGAWLDPIMLLIAGYEILRRGDGAGMRHILEIVGNLRTYFPGIPDTEVIAYRAGLAHHAIGDAPLFTDGLLLLEDAEDLLPLPASRLDYSSPWTLWRGAVHTRSNGDEGTRAGYAGAV